MSATVDRKAEPPNTRRHRRARSTRRARTPTVIQMEAVECGAAALAIVLAHHGRWIPLEELRKQCGVSRDGSRAANLLRAARSYGFEARGFQMETSKLRNLEGPYIVFWNFHHFLVVEGFDDDTVFLNDPASGPRKVKLQEFDNSYTGVVLTLTPKPEFQPGGSKPSILAGLGERLSGGRAALALVFAASLLLVIPGLMTPAFLRIFVDRVLTSGFTSWVGPLLVVMVLTALGAMALTSLQQHYLLRLETRIALRSSSSFFRHVLRLPVDFFTQRQPADVATRVNANDTVAQLLSRDLATTLISGTLVLFYAVVMLSYDVLLTVLGVVVVTLNIVVLRTVARLRVDATARLRQDRGKLVSTTYNGLQLIETLKATGTESDFFARWAGFQTKVANGQQRLGVPSQVLAVVPTLLAGVNTALILWIGGLRAIDGAITIGVLIAFQSLLNSFTRPVQQLTQLGQKLQDVTADINRLGDVERNPAAPVFDDPAAADHDRVVEGHVELRDITFGYSPLAQPLIEDLSISVAPGRRVALVGGSGSGKSTIARVIAGLYEPWSGEVLFDGRPRAHYARHALGASVAVVDQDIFLFEGSVRDNLSMWDTTIPDEVMVEALEDALIHDVIAEGGGLDFVIAEGGRNLSGGQRQRLEIARALTVRPRVLVLDEATSALDTETERLIDLNLRRRGCTCVIVAHRLSTIRDADEIIVLEFGKVVQRGAHDEMKAVDGPYATLIGAE